MFFTQVVVAIVLAIACVIASAEYNYQTIDVTDSTSTAILGANQNSSVGLYTFAGTTRGFIRQNAGEFLDVFVPGSVSTVLTGISSNGKAVGVWVDANEAFHGFVYDGAFTILDFPGAVGTFGRGINASGWVVGAYQDTQGQFHGFIYKDGSFETVDVYGSGFVWLHGINNQGKITGAFVDSNGTFQGFVKHGDVVSIIQDADPVQYRDAQKISNSGAVAGMFIAADNSAHGYVYSAGQFASITIQDAVYTAAFDVSDAGVVYGLFMDEAGVEHGFMATPIR